MNELEGFGLDEIPYVSTYISTCEKDTYGTSVIVQKREANMWSFNNNNKSRLPRNVHKQMKGGMK